jgi:tetratricopeptide (TPR) repeat protein
VHKLIVIAALLAAGAPQAQAQTASAPTSTPAGTRSPNAGALFVQGMMQNDKGDNVAAKASLDEALRLKPDFQPARLVRITVLSELKQTDAALADLDMLAAGLPPETVLRMRIDLLRDGARYREAIKAGEALVALQPRSADAWRILGHTRQYSEINAEMPAALANYDKALKLDPDMLRVYGLRGEILSAQRDVKGVERNYQAWLAKAPDDAEAHAAYANALVRIGKTDEAKFEIDRALAL